MNNGNNGQILGANLYNDISLIRGDLQPSREPAEKNDDLSSLGFLDVSLDGSTQDDSEQP